MRDPTQNLGPIGSAFDVYWTQTDRQRRKVKVKVINIDFLNQDLKILDIFDFKAIDKYEN